MLNLIKVEFVKWLFLAIAMLCIPDRVAYGKKNDLTNIEWLAKMQHKQEDKSKTAENIKDKDLLLPLQNFRANDSLRLAEKKKKIERMHRMETGHPVIGFFKDTLFQIYARSGSFSSRERAEAITNRIHRLSKKLNFDKDSLKLSEAENAYDIAYGEEIIMSISENDALLNHTSKAVLAEKYKILIGNAVTDYKKETDFPVLLKEIAIALLLLIFLGIILFLVARIFRFTASKIVEREGKQIKGIKLKNYILFDSKRQVKALLSINRIVKWLVTLVLIYITLPLLFGIFPWTQNFAETLFGYILNPLKKIVFGFWHYLPNLVTLLVICTVFNYGIKGMKFLKNEIEKERLKIDGFYPDWANPTYQILRVLVYAFMLVVIFPYLPGSDSPIFKGVSVFLGFLFTFGSAGSLSNVIAGLVLTYMRLFKIGDRVKIGEVTGDVIEKSLLVTRIKTPKNEIISIPNSTVMSNHTINFSSEAMKKGLILHTTVTIGYDVPWKDISQALLNASERTEELLKDPEPFVLQTSLDDFYVSYQINAYTKNANSQASIYSKLHANIQDCCNEMGIEIMSPHYRAARDGNTTTIPQDYLDPDYKSPAFKVENNDK